MEFDFDKDIAPLRGRHFGGHLGFTGREAAYATRRGASLIPLVEANNKAALDAARMRNEDLQHRTALLQLRNAKKDTRMQRKAMQLVPVVTQQLDNLFNNPDATPQDLAAGYAQIVAKNPEVATTQAGNNMLQAYQNRLTMTDQAFAKKEAEAREASSQDLRSQFDVANTILQEGGSAADVEDLFSNFKKVDDAGNVTWTNPAVERYMKATDTVSKLRANKKQEAAREASAVGQANADNQRRDKNREALFTYISKDIDLEIPEGSENTTPTQLKTADKAVIRGLMLGMGYSEEELDNLTDVDLFERAARVAAEGPKSRAAPGRGISSAYGTSN